MAYFAAHFVWQTVRRTLHIADCGKFQINIDSWREHDISLGIHIISLLYVSREVKDAVFLE